MAATSWKLSVQSSIDGVRFKSKINLGYRMQSCPFEGRGETEEEDKRGGEKKVYARWLMGLAPVVPIPLWGSWVAMTVRCKVLGSIRLVPC